MDVMDVVRLLALYVVAPVVGIAGAAVVVVNVVLWVVEARSRRGAGAQAAAVSADLRQRAIEVVKRVAARAGVSVPALRIEPVLGVPTSRHPVIGSGGIGMVYPGRKPVLALAAAALSELGDPASDLAVAHEFAHLRRPRGGTVVRSAQLLTALIAAGVVGALIVDGGADLMASLIAWAAVFIVLLMVGFGCAAMAHWAWLRADELACDRYAIELVGDLDAAEEWMGLVSRIEPTPPVGAVRAFSWRVYRRWFATHPTPEARLRCV